MNKRMRKLIQQLGEAIHDSVSESELIAGVVQDIRKHGFDVLLMLEATIGLNEVEQQPPSLAAASEGVSEVKALGTGEGGSFTQQDVKFLRSLRISVEGEARSQNGEDTLDRNGDTATRTPTTTPSPASSHNLPKHRAKVQDSP